MGDFTCCYAPTQGLLFVTFCPRVGGFEPWLYSLVLVFKIISTFIGQNPKLFFMHVLKKDVLLL